MRGVTLDAVRKSYGRHTVIDGLDLEIEHGEFLVLLGPSGCGKSTLLSMIAGLEPITAGRVLIGERDVTALEPDERDIAMVFQSYALYPTMTVRRNIGFGLSMRGTPRAEVERKVQEVAALLRIDALLDRRPSELSGGQQQRVAIGRALVRHPRVFLFDEPLSNLDAKLRADMRVELKRLHERVGRTMIYVTHDQIEAMTMATRIVVMDRGRIQQCDAPEIVYDRPANRFVASFVGAPTMNFLEGRLAAGDGLSCLDCGGTRLPLPGLAVPGAEEGRAVTLGFRPEHVRIASDGDPGAFAARAVMAEPTGPDLYVLLETAAGEITARVAPHHGIRRGASLPLTLDGTRVSLFDPTHGHRLH